MASIQGKVAIVTGSARGIGAGIASRFGKEGAKVICLDRNPAAETVNHIKSNGGDAMAIQCDISKQASIEAAVRQVLDTYGTIDILVNSAGLSKMASITDATEADWDYVNNVTLKGTWIDDQRCSTHYESQQKRQDYQYRLHFRLRCLCGSIHLLRRQGRCGQYDA